MKLKDYITEYVSSGRNRFKRFPEQAVYSDDKDSITSWLESNGFKRVPDVYLGSVMGPSKAIVISKNSDQRYTTMVTSKTRAHTGYNSVTNGGCSF